VQIRADFAQYLIADGGVGSSRGLSWAIEKDTMAAMRSTLRRRLILYVGLMASGSLLLGLCAVLGVNAVHDDLRIALQGNQQLRQVFEVGLEIATAKRDMEADRPDRAAATTALERALASLEMAPLETSTASPPAWLDESRRARCRSLVQRALSELKGQGTGDGAVADSDALNATFNDLLGELSNITSQLRHAIAAKQVAAEDQRYRTLVTTISLSLFILLAAILIGWRLYVSVMRPLNRLRRGVQNFAAGHFDERIAVHGDMEFASLAADFNFMAGELEALYRELEEKVAARSKELVRSQRLASVGYLAAGVAHEMNNPLGIIAGYGERSLQHLARGLDSTTLTSAQRAITIMCEEAFRCKEITARLLSLARPGSGDRRPLRVIAIMQEVISNLGGLPEYASRRITLEAPAQTEQQVIGRDGELRQVFINLILNALQATSPGTGEVHVAVKGVGSSVEISVSDNGSGMTTDTLDRVFEPFFTQKRGQQRPGTGLGLSITHAIVLDHGGRITAHSAGPGRGSRFNLVLPSANLPEDRKADEANADAGEGADLADVA
jgi:two-component system NtrC family sensor kinase